MIDKMARNFIRLRKNKIKSTNQTKSCSRDRISVSLYKSTMNVANTVSGTFKLHVPKMWLSKGLKSAIFSTIKLLHMTVNAHLHEKCQWLPKCSFKNDICGYRVFFRCLTPQHICLLILPLSWSNHVCEKLDNRQNITANVKQTRIIIHVLDQTHLSILHSTRFHDFTTVLVRVVYTLDSRPAI